MHAERTRVELRLVARDHGVDDLDGERYWVWLEEWDGTEWRSTADEDRGVGSTYIAAVTELRERFPHDSSQRHVKGPPVWKNV